MTGRLSPRDSWCRKTTGNPDPCGEVVMDGPMAGTWTGAVLLPLLPRLLRECPPPSRCD